jgi:hypothetical protein
VDDVRLCLRQHPFEVGEAGVDRVALADRVDNRRLQIADADDLRRRYPPELLDVLERDRAKADERRPQRRLSRFGLHCPQVSPSEGR